MLCLVSVVFDLFSLCYVWFVWFLRLWKVFRFCIKSNLNSHAAERGGQVGEIDARMNKT